MTENLKDIMVLGHTCPGLESHYSFVTYQCVPNICEDGTITGCDDSNQLAIRFCPFCGQQLKEVPDKWPDGREIAQLDGTERRKVR